MGEVLWAKQWLEEVEQARKALTVNELALESMREDLFTIPSPMGRAGEITYHDNSRDKSMDKVDRVMDLEAEGDALDWARNAIIFYDKWEQMMTREMRGEFAYGLTIITYRYRYGYKMTVIAKMLNIGRRTAYKYMNQLIDYMDYCGKRSILYGEEKAVV